MRYFTNRYITQHKLPIIGALFKVERERFRGKRYLPHAFFVVGAADLESKRNPPHYGMRGLFRKKRDLPRHYLWLYWAF